jgi:mono/diheme cytochrome c family protein
MKTKSLLFLISIVKKNIIILGALVVTAGLYSFTFFQAKPWVVPDAYVKKSNPVKSDAESLKDAKELWNKHCVSCHGKTGAGDGTKAAQLETEMADFSKDAVQKQTDGSMLYKILEGRDEMPTFKKKIPEESDIWGLVNYIRTLKK